MKKCLLLLLLALVPFTRAEENKATHDELRGLRDRLLAALNKGDLEAMVSQLATNCVVTWQNGEISRGGMVFGVTTTDDDRAWPHR